MSIEYVSRPGGLGFMDYNSTDAEFAVAANVWTTVENNGLGSSTNKGFSLSSVPEVMDSVGRVVFDSLALGDALLVRTDLTVTASVNGASLEYRWVLGEDPGGLYTLPSFLGTLANGAGVPVRFIFSSYVYAGDLNTYNNPVELQVRSSEVCVVNNAGSAIQLFRKGE
mgnify:FL=1